MPTYLPLILLVAVAIQGARLKSKKFVLPPNPWWPQSENPGLAMQLAHSPAFADRLLGGSGSQEGAPNRKALIEVQQADYLLIPLYVAFLIAAAGWVVAIPLAVLAGLADYLEDFAIVRMAEGKPGTPPRRFGQAKWILYFLTVLAETRALFIFQLTGPVERSLLLGIAGILAFSAVWGIGAALKAGFSGISAAFKLSAFGLAGLALAPFLEHPPYSLHVAAEYISLMRVPLLFGVVILALPFLAFFTGAGSLLKGLFDLRPPGLLLLTLAVTAAAGTVADNLRIVYTHAWDRFPDMVQSPAPIDRIWLYITLGVSFPTVLAAVLFSIKQKYSVAGLIAAAAGGMAIAAFTVHLLGLYGSDIAGFFLNAPREQRLTDWMLNTGLFAGYVARPKVLKLDPGMWTDHLTAMAGFLITALLYTGLGIYGRQRLGKKGTVPALCAALMLIMMLCWMLSAASFFFDEWRIPLLLIVIVAGTLTAQSRNSDHYYHLTKRQQTDKPPTPKETILAGRRRRTIVVAANGGGIQAGAWAAQVLQGLHEFCDPDFGPAVRLISSVSGGSVGNACYVYWLADPDLARNPVDAAAESSIDEVAWGLGWPDFLRALCPWFCAWMIGRGRALEQAWCLNAAKDPSQGSHLDSPLSNWNRRVAKGDLPAVVMNATVTETGERLLLATTHLAHHHAGNRARVDGDDLHDINGEHLDLAVVTAARLSASFPYVTPAARSDGPGLQPHIVDGGYYDNYGMATLTEWLDEALTGVGKDEMESVLVIQIHGAPVTENDAEQRHSKSRGWFYQAIAPILTMANVRSSGQIAHNDIELDLLQDKWSAAGIPVHALLFEFPDPNAPLSWHLTQSDKDRIRAAWENRMGPCKLGVRAFLDGQRVVPECRCPDCKPRGKSYTAVR